MMSTQAVTYVLANAPGVRLGERVLLIAIAHHAGREPVRGWDGRQAFEAWPRVALLAEETGLHPSTVREYAGALEKRGLLERVVNGAPVKGRGGDPRRRANLYRILVTGAGKPAPHSALEGAGDPGARVAPMGDAVPGTVMGAGIPEGVASMGAGKHALWVPGNPDMNNKGTTMSRGFTDTHARDDENADDPRAHAAVRLLAEIDTREHPDWSWSQRLEHHTCEHLPALVDLAGRYPAMTPADLATHVLNAPVFTQRPNPDLEAEGIAAARRALHPSSGTPPHDDG